MKFIIDTYEQSYSEPQPETSQSTERSATIIVNYNLKRGIECDVLPKSFSVLIDRSAGEVGFDCRYEPLARLSMQSWEPAACELCAAGQRLIDPDDIVLGAQP